MLTEVPGSEGEGSRRSLAVAATVGRRQRTVLTVVALASVEPNPEQPRRYFAEDKLAELAVSILERGLLQPIVVRRRAEGGYQLLAGERRFRAAQLAGLDRLPAVVREGGDALEIALIENLQREDLGPLEEAEALAALVDRHGYSHREIADLLGKSRPYVSNTLALTRLPEPVKADLYQEGRTFSREVLMGIARQADPQAAVTLWNRLKLEAMSVRQFREERIAPARTRSPVREAVLAARRLNRSLRRLERSRVTSGEVGPLGRVLRRTRRLIEEVTASLEGRSELAGDPVA
jgi:ParB family transcriptional regulator, chromosome partitioning protein